jgi:hypothetical protein
MISHAKAVVFLDFDGVLNRYGSSPANIPGANHMGLEPELVQRMAAFVEREHAAVVISSSWRQLYALSALQQFLTLFGGGAIAARMHGMTPTLPGAHVRNEEVELFRKVYCLLDVPYVIIDDAEKHRFPRDRFVRTLAHIGFTEGDAASASAVLASQGCLSPPPRQLVVSAGDA